MTALEPPETGTMHYVREVTISLAGHGPMTLRTDVGGGILAPFVTRQYELPGRQYLVLGFCSWGGGTETVQVVLVGARNGRLERLDQLNVTAPRGQCGILVRRTAGATEIGVFEPRDADINCGQWWISRGVCQAQPGPGELESQMPIFGPPVADLRPDLLYQPRILCVGGSYHDALARRRIAWFEIADGRFVVRTSYPAMDYAAAINHGCPQGSRRTTMLSCQLFASSGRACFRRRRSGRFLRPWA